MALPASDLFNNVSGSTQALATYSASWTIVQGSYNVTTADVCQAATGSTTNYARWNADTPNAAQYSRVRIAAVPGSDYPGVAVRVQSGSVAGYYFITDGAGYNELGRTVAGVDTILDTSITQVFAVGDWLHLEVSDPDASTVRLTMKRAAAATPTSFTTLGTVDDTNASRITAAGYLGIAQYYNGGTPGSIDRWEGGNTGGGGGGGGAVPVFVHQLRQQGFL